MLHHINIIIHVAAAIAAIGIGILAYVTRKGSNAHVRVGRIFLFFMSIVIITALNGVFFFIDRPFLTVVTFQSFYLSFSGYRVLKVRHTGLRWYDLAVMLLVLSVAAGFILNTYTANVVWNKAVVYYLLSYLLLIVLFDLLRYFLPQLITHQKFWLYEHIFKMTGAFVALASAGMGTVMVSWEPYNQIVPSILGSLWLVFCLIYFPRVIGK
jgi:hypothetical protein